MKEPNNGHAADWGTIRILIVDDHPLVRLSLREVIQRESDLVVCGEAEDREQALAAVAATIDDSHRPAQAHDQHATHADLPTVDHEHGHGPRDFDAIWNTASSSQRAAATQLITATSASVARYEDVNVALADGFRPNPNQHGPLVHYPNWRNRRDGKVLDPNALEGLVYLQRRDGTTRLVAALYTAGGATVPPAPGGEITMWHSHTPGCEHPTETPGCEQRVRMYMLHVWFGPRVHDPFADTFRAAHV